MSLIDDLRPRVKNHPHYNLFKGFSKEAAARKIGISGGYLRGILTGHYKPSKPVAEKIEVLAKALRAELEAQGAIVDDRG